jgi:TPR repeat protein
MTTDRGTANSLARSSRSLQAKTGLLKRGIGLAASVGAGSLTESREAEAQRYLRWAWIEFPQSSSYARKFGAEYVGHLDDAYAHAVFAAVLFAGIELADRRTSELATDVLRRATATASTTPVFGREVERLIARMKKLECGDDEESSKRAKEQIAKHELEDLIGEFASFIEAINSHLDPAQATLRERARAGDAEAQYCFGWWCDAGSGVPQDSEQSKYWWEKSAEQGHADAQFYTGMAYDACLPGEPPTSDSERAAYWYRKAAQQGHRDARETLGHFYAEGRGVPKNEPEAYEWWRAGAELGDSDAQRHLGRLYRDGRCISRDYIEAYKWLILAAAREPFIKHNHANEREAIASQMTPDEVAEAQRRAEAWTEAFEQRQKQLNLLGDGVSVANRETSGLPILNEDAPVVRLVNDVLLAAIQKGASDIHFEPYEKAMVVRYRIDGILYDIMNPPMTFRDAIASRIRNMAKLDTAGSRLPQNGCIKIRFTDSGVQQEEDVCVSVLSTPFGAKAVMHRPDLIRLFPSELQAVTAERSADDVEALIEQGSQGLYDREAALVCFEKALEIDMKCTRAWYWKGVFLYELSRWAESIESYDMALAIEPSHKDSWVGRGYVLTKLGLNEEAVRSFDVARQIVRLSD